MDDHHAAKLERAILILAEAVNSIAQERRNELEFFRLSSLATKRDLKRLEDKIMSKLKELGPTLGNVLDMLNLILTEVTDLENNLTNVDLPDDAQANLDKLTSIVPAIQKILTPAAGTDIVTLDTIANQTAPVSGPAQDVPLTGIGSSAKGATLSASVVSSDTNVVPTASVVLDTPQSPTGTLTFTPGAAGVATLTVTIGDGNAQAVKLFTVTVA